MIKFIYQPKQPEHSTVYFEPVTIEFPEGNGQESIEDLIKMFRLFLIALTFEPETVDDRLGLIEIPIKLGE